MLPTLWGDEGHHTIIDSFPRYWIDFGIDCSSFFGDSNSH